VFSSWLQNFLERTVGGRSMIVGRETAIRPSPTGEGRDESLDLRVDATALEEGGESATVSVMIEVKGSWNQELMSAMEAQLVDRYLDTSHTQGIYLVGFFAAEDWDETHSARRVARRYTYEDLEAKLAAQATTISEQRGVGVSAVVINCSLLPQRRRSKKSSRRTHGGRRSS
jgi:hypothetical protein